ncbi:phage late control D family protein [Paraburkholderia youngii]|uniref:phage late control D family protein n=1 Tax=Paraburkholderia youngii TaxID=2782701 RepID=UPI003D243B68
MATQISFALGIAGSPAPATVLNAIKRIEMEDHAQMADMMRLRLSVAVKEDGSGWTLIDDTLFTRLVHLTLSVTVGTGRATPLISAYVIDVDTKFANEPGGSELIVTAMDPTVLMHLDERVKSWPNMKDSDVANAIFRDAHYGFTPIVDDTGWSRHEDDVTLMQRGTDIQFLQHLAARNGYECFVELSDNGEVEGHFHPPRHDGQPQGTLTVNTGSATNVNRFRAKFDMLGPTTARAATLDPDDATKQSGRADNATQSDGMGDQPAVPADRPRTVLLSQLGMAQAGEVQRYAQAVVDRSSWSIVADGELNTVAYGGVLKAKQSVMVRGVGKQFSGRYYVERVLHTIDSDGGYTQRFTLRRNATGLTGQENFRSDDALA